MTDSTDDVDWYSGDDGYEMPDEEPEIDQLKAEVVTLKAELAEAVHLMKTCRPLVSCHHMSCEDCSIHHGCDIYAFLQRHKESENDAVMGDKP